MQIGQKYKLEIKKERESEREREREREREKEICKKVKHQNNKDII